MKRWIPFYKQHRDVFGNGEIIHLRHPTGRDWEGILHANPAGEEKVLTCIYKPLTENLTRTIRIPFYYTGLREAARSFMNGASQKTVALTPTSDAVVTAKAPPGGRSFILFTE